MKQILTIIIIGSLSLFTFNTFSQNKGQGENAYFSRHHSVKTSFAGFNAMACLINGEIYSTHDHEDFKTICTTSKGELIPPGKGHQKAGLANQLGYICCKNPSTNKHFFVLTRGQKSDQGCGGAGKKLEKSKACFKAKASLFNKPADFTNYTPTTSGPTLREYLSDNQNKLKCGIHETKKKGSVIENLSSPGKGSALSYPIYSPSKDTKTKTDTDKKPSIIPNQGVPICCQYGRGKKDYKVVANECACLLSPPSRAGFTPKSVPIKAHTCGDLHTVITKDLEELKLKRTHQSLIDEAGEMFKENTCFLSGKNPIKKTCHDHDINIFYNITCKNKKETVTRTILCHKDFAFEDDKTTRQLTKDDATDFKTNCHIAENN